MANAFRDENFVPTMLMGVDPADGVTPVVAQINPVSGRLLVGVYDRSHSPSAVATRNVKDDNRVPCGRGESSVTAGDSIPFHAHTDIAANNLLLIKRVP